MSSQQQQGGFSKLLQQQKKTFYQFTNELVNNQFNLYIYYTLIIIEHLQIIAYQCHEAYAYNNIATDWFRTLTHFVNPEYYLKHSHLMDVFVPLSFGLVLGHAGLLGYGYYRHRKKGDDHIQSRKQAVLVVAHYVTVIMVTVMTAPIFLSSLLAFYCHSQNPYHPDRQCYNTYHLFIILLSFFNLIWTAIINLYFFLFYFTKNPFAYKNFLSVSSSLWNLLKFTLKVVPPGYLIFDQVLEFNILFVFGIAAGLLGYTAIARVLYPYSRYNKHIEKVMIYIEITFITMSLLFILQAFFTDQEGNNVSFLASFIIAIPLSKLAFDMLIKKQEKNILEINKFDKDKTETIESLLTYMIFLLQEDKTPAKAKRFFKIVKLHNDKCDNPQCPCEQYLRKYQQQQNYFMDQDVIYRIFLQIIDRCVANNKKAYSLILIKSYIQYYRLGNGVKGAFIISKIMREKISFFDDYLINGFLYQVSKSFSDTTTIQTYRQFSQHLNDFEHSTMQLASYLAQFWQQISQQNSSLKKVMNLLSLAHSTKQLVQRQFQTLYSIYPTNIRIASISMQLYKQVLINYQQFIKYKNMHAQNSQLKQDSKLIRPQHQIKFTANEDLIVMNSSVNVINDIFHGGCEIVSVTSNVYKVLGYASQELIGKNINRFLPKLYCEFHDKMVDGYLSRNQGEMRSRELVIFPINSNGYLVECAMVNKIMPSLEYGVNIISFMLNSKYSKENLIIYDQRTGLVDSMSEKAQAFLLGKKSKKTSISIPDHISDILPAWDYLKEQTKQQHKKSSQSQEFQFSFNNVQLYRSDGPADSKHVKVISFEVTFHSKLFSMKECMIDNDNIWLGIQTLVDNTPYRVKLAERSDNLAPIGLQDNKSSLGESPNTMLPKPTNRQSAILQDTTKLYQPLPQCYPKLYIILQILILISLIALIVYSYFICLAYFDTLRKDFLIKENINDALDTLLEQSHSASHYIFSHSDPTIKAQLNVDNSTSQLKQLINIGQFIYQQLVKKQQSNQVPISDIMVEVQYYTSPSTIVVKSQTVTDATYQLVLYLLEIYKNQSPINSLPNNVLFVANNCLNISDQFVNLNQIFTNNLLSNSQTRKTHLRNLVIAILAIFSISIIWQTIYKLAVDSKVNRVIQVYEAIPIQQLEKYPVKCHNFIKAVCPIDSTTLNLQNNIKSVRKLGANLQQQNAKKQLATYQGSLPLDDEEEVEYITFSTSLSLKHILIQSVMFLILFSSLFILELNSENTVIDQNLSQVNDWNKITRFRSELIKTLYLINQHKNRAGQWNSTQLIGIQKMFHQSLTKVEHLLKSTTALDPYLSVSYELIEDAVFIINSKNITSQQFILNEQKIQKLYNEVQKSLIDGTFQKNIQSTVSEFLGMNQLIFIGQIIIFLLYAIVYIPKSYSSYQNKNLLTQMMYDTLGYKLQNIAKMILAFFSKILSRFHPYCKHQNSPNRCFFRTPIAYYL